MPRGSRESLQGQSRSAGDSAPGPLPAHGWEARPGGGVPKILSKELAPEAEDQRPKGPDGTVLDCRPPFEPRGIRARGAGAPPVPALPAAVPQPQPTEPGAAPVPPAMPLPAPDRSQATMVLGVPAPLFGEGGGAGGNGTSHVPPVHLLWGPAAFVHDVRLVLANATTYNQRGHWVAKLARQTLRKFELSWAKARGDFARIAEEEEVAARAAAAEIERRARQRAARRPRARGAAGGRDHWRHRPPGRRPRAPWARRLPPPGETRETPPSGRPLREGSRDQPGLGRAGGLRCWPARSFWTAPVLARYGPVSRECLERGRVLCWYARGVGEATNPTARRLSRVVARPPPRPVAGREKLEDAFPAAVSGRQNQAAASHGGRAGGGEGKD